MGILQRELVAIFLLSIGSGLIHVQIVLFFVHGGPTVQKLVKYRVELPRHAVLQIRAMHWVLLHLSEDIALENIAKKAIMGFF